VNLLQENNNKNILIQKCTKKIQNDSQTSDIRKFPIIESNDVIN